MNTLINRATLQLSLMYTIYYSWRPVCIERVFALHRDMKLFAEGSIAIAPIPTHHIFYGPHFEGVTYFSVKNDRSETT